MVVVRRDTRPYLENVHGTPPAQSDLAPRAADSDMSAQSDSQGLLGLLGRGFHDLRNPIATAYSVCEMLEAGWYRMADHDRLRRVARMRGTLGNAVSHLNRLQMIVRLERGASDEPGQPFAVRPLVEELAREAGVDRGGSRASVRIVGDLPDMVGEPGLVRALLAELIENSLKFSPPGASVELRLGVDGGNRVVEVLDQGIGVPEGEEEAIFEAFRRGSNAADFPGCGLGLALARRIAERMGGSLVYVPGMRGRFVLALPGPGEEA